MGFSTIFSDQLFTSLTNFGIEPQLKTNSSVSLGFPLSISLSESIKTGRVSTTIGVTGYYFLEPAIGLKISSNFSFGIIDTSSRYNIGGGICFKPDSIISFSAEAFYLQYINSISCMEISLSANIGVLHISNNPK